MGHRPAADRREFPFDLVHAQHYGGATRAYAACRLFGWPLVYEIHSLLGEEVERDRLGRGLAFRLNVALEKRACRLAAAVIVLGEPVKKVVVEEKGVPAGTGLGDLPGHRPGRVRNAGRTGRDPGDRRPAQGGDVRRQHRPPEPGGADPDRRPAEGLRAVPEARCVLVGGPASAGEEYRSRLGAFGDRLIVLAGQTPEQVVALTRRADVLVHPRLACRENYSVQSKIAVYLASGRPIVATDFADYTTILGDTGAGRLTAVTPGSLAEGILEVLHDPALAARLSAATGPVARELFGMDRNIDRYLHIYRKVRARAHPPERGPVPRGPHVPVPGFSGSEARAGL